jgi:cytochrome o ubiquinol oxidase subunit 3
MNERTLINESQEDSKTLFGFWMYIMTDCILFASLFATFAVLRNSIFGGPSGKDLFSLPFVLTETLILLTSSFTCGLGMLSIHARNKKLALTFFGITFLLGLSFLGLEINEFHKLASEGNSWRRSGFLSAFFTLVGTHGAHISMGLVWMATMMARLYGDGFKANTAKRFTMLSLFWHFLDIVWIFIFSIVYLMGVI